MTNHSVVHVGWQPGRNQLTREDLKEGVVMSRKSGAEVTEKEIRSACLVADLLIAFMVRLN